MFPKPDNKEVDNEKEANCTKTEAELETSLIEKTKLEETYLSQLRYARADLENLQKQIQRRIDEGVTREKAKLIMQLLPVVEDVDLTLAEAKKGRNSTLLEGIEMVRKKLWKVLNCEGLCPIEAIGKPFDPHMHEALQKIETCDCPEGIVVQEVRKGYLLNDTVFRPSLVKVSCLPDSVQVKLKK
jgi:molecular chaperone GrpE